MVFALPSSKRSIKRGPNARPLVGSMLFRGSPQGQTLKRAPNPRPSQHPRQREPNPIRLGTLPTRQAFVRFLILCMYSYSYTSVLAATYPPIFCVCIRILVGPCWHPDGSNGHTCSNARACCYATRLLLLLRLSKRACAWASPAA
jgi:hypothetical protein